MSIICKDSIATRITKHLERTSLTTHLFPKTTSILAFALIVINAGAITIAKIAPQMVKNAIIVELQDTLERSALSPKSHNPKTKTSTKKCQSD